jgi:dienelactone hydrolase
MLTPMKRSAVLAVLAVAVFGCGDDAAEVAPHPEWIPDASAINNPLPDDRMLLDGRVALRERYYERFLGTAALNDASAALFTRHAAFVAGLDGWGTYASILIPFSDPLDDAPPTAFSLSPLERPEEPVPIEVLHHASFRVVELRPLAPLEPGAQYAYRVHRGLTAGGRAVEAPPGAPADGDAILSVTFTTAHVRDELVAAAAELATVVPETDFTMATAEPWPHGVYTPDAFLAAIAPDEASSLGDGLAYAGTVAVGTFRERDFRGADGVFDPAVIAGDATPTLHDVELVLVLPDAAAHPPPWPASIVQHGFSGSNRDVLRHAEILNRHGIAAIGIDALEHGNRGDITSFFHPEDLRGARENFRQTVLDHIQLCRIVAAGALDLDGQPGPDLDGRCHYIGQSMGGVLGALYAAVSPDTDIAVINVGGGGITRILQSEFMYPFVKLLFASELGLSASDPAFEEALPLFAWLAQTLFDPGDPINFGAIVIKEPPAHAKPQRHVLMQLGIGDGLVPNAASEALAVAIGIPTVDRPTNDAAGVDGAWWIDLADYGIAQDGETAHDILNKVPGVRTQIGAYMASDATEIIDPAAAP